MTIPNWNELTWYHYLALGDVLVIVALLLYFAVGTRLKMPAIFVGILGGVAVGAALGAALIIAMIVFDIKRDRDWANYGDDPAAANAGGPPGIGKGGPPGKGKGGPPGKGKGFAKGAPGGAGGGGGGGRAPSPKAQLATLVTKLDLLTHKPLAVKLDDEQKKKVRESLEKLDTEKELKDDDAKAKLDELQKILTEDQRKTLEAAGYRWPPQGGGGRAGVLGGAGQSPPNPFSEGENSQHLKSLLAELK